MGVIVTHSTSTAGASGGGAFTQAEKLALQMEMEFIASQESYYKELSYVTDPGPLRGSLLDVDIYTDSGKTVQLFHKDLFYDDVTRLLDRTLLTRISDGAALLKQLTYDASDNLISITVSAG